MASMRSGGRSSRIFFRSRDYRFEQYGKFGWTMDLEGNKVELWQPLQGQ